MFMNVANNVVIDKVSEPIAEGRTGSPAAAPALSHPELKHALCKGYICAMHMH